MLRTLLLTLVAALVMAASASGATLQVPGQYASLGAAYNAASSGDVVEIAAGNYPAQTLPSGTKQVTFRGVTGPASTGAVLRSLYKNATEESMRLADTLGINGTPTR